MKFSTFVSAFLISTLAPILHSAEEYQQVFPKVQTKQNPGILPFLASYAKEHGLKPLSPNHVRFFVQPMGVIDSAFDVDLGSGAITRYPGTHGGQEIVKGTLDAETLKVLKDSLTSDKFRSLPEQSSKMGLDGCSYFIEVDLEKKYLWRLRWQPDEPVFKTIENLLKTKWTPKSIRG